MDEGLSMCFGGAKPKIPKPPTPPSEVGANLSALRKTRERALSADLSGRASTLLTGATGVGNQSATKKTLLGA